VSDEDMLKLRHLPGTTLTPEVVLHRTLNKLPRIKAVAIVIQWDDGSMDTDWSQMQRSELFMTAYSLTSDVHALMRGDTSVEGV
jgi:hypothetical protein